jgi:uncharacterized protein (TIGR02646 family)
MIQLKYQPKPEKLTDHKFVQELTAKFKATGESVWSKDYIKSALLQMSHNKCCYCEAKLNVSGNDMEVEHFLPKSIFPDKVVEWENLFPSCGHCNGKKFTLNPQITPIIHPVHDNPQNHLKMNKFRIIGKDEKGKNLVLKLGLNEGKSINPRFEVGNKVAQTLDELLADIQEHLSNKARTQNMETRIKNRLERLLLECCPESDYSAACASILIHDENYTDIKNLFQQHNLWNADFDSLEQKVKSCAFAEK